MRYLNLIALVLMLALPAVAAGQGADQSPAPAQPTELTPGMIQSELDALESAPDIADSVREEVGETLRKALELAKRAEGFAAETRQYRQAAENARDQLATIEQQLEEQNAQPVEEIPADATLEEIEQLLAEATDELASARQTLTDLQAEESRRLERRAVIPEQTSAARKRLTDLQAEPPVQSLEGESSKSLEARRLLRKATELAIQREIESLESELASYDARRELLPAKRDRANQLMDAIESRVNTLQSAVKERREAEAQQAAQEAMRQQADAAQLHEVLQAYAAETADRAAARAGAQGEATRIDAAASESSTIRAEMSRWRAEFASIQRRLGAAGLNRATGLQLRKQYDSLPDPDDLERRVRKSQEAAEDAEYRLIELQEERAALGDIDENVDALMAQIPQTEMPEDRNRLESVARKLVIDRRELVNNSIADTSAYFDATIELNDALREKLVLTEEYRSFIEERIFWVRSIAGDRMLRTSDVRETTAWLLSPSSWIESIRAVGSYTRQSWAAISGVIIVLAIIWLPQVRVRRRLQRLGELVSRYNTDAYIHTLEAFLWTFVRALPVPATLWAIGWVLASPIDQTRVAAAIGSGLEDGALLLYPLMFLRQTLRTRGLAEAHFRWPAQSIASLRRHLHWLMPVLTVAQIIVSAIEYESQDAYSASIGRIAFTVGLVALSAFLRRVLKPQGQVLKRFIEDNPGGLITRLRYVWYPLAFLLPISFAVLSWTGFHYTALQLEIKLEYSLVLAMALVILNGVMLRWLFIARRRVAVEDAKRKREQAAAEAEAKHESGGEPQAEAPPLDEDKVDLPALSQQTRQLFKAASTVTVVLGLYLIWAQALPALRMLDRVQLLPEIRITEGEPTSVAQLTTPERSTEKSSSESSTSSPELLSGLSSELSQDASDGDMQIVPKVSITLADLGLAIVVLIVTWASFRNVPGLVEIVVLQRLPLDSGSRYALSTVMRYIIATIGVLVAAGTMGLAWSNVQWLAAALTFGLAFGLQEIFANFISGLIILAERPIRLGDTVTVDSVTGTVTRIRMRATTITDWDRKELIIPNKTFITSDVINWTLSDPSLRITIPVGVSYGSDVENVERTLQRIAGENPVVLTDPKPYVLFKSFGDSTLDFELRVHIPSIEHLISVRHALHMAITKAFREEDIEIAFPQQDLHVRSIEGLEGILNPTRKDSPDDEG
ncbi:MAG: mechanosensitive ion channel domain-containing protein [Phycisphaerales bacterium JB058]